MQARIEERGEAAAKDADNPGGAQPLARERVREEWSGGRPDLPAWKHEDSRMAMQGGAEHLGTLNAQVDATILDAGDSGLGNAAQGRKLGLAEALQLTDDPHRLAGGDIDTLLGGNEFAHINVSDSHEV